MEERNLVGTLAPRGSAQEKVRKVSNFVPILLSVPKLNISLVLIRANPYQGFVASFIAMIVLMKARNHDSIAPSPSLLIELHWCDTSQMHPSMNQLSGYHGPLRVRGRCYDIGPVDSSVWCFCCSYLTGKHTPQFFGQCFAIFRGRAINPNCR